MGKRLGGCLNVFAWMNNAFWGTLFLIAGVYAMFWQQNFWFGVLGVGVGIYFFWRKSWTRKTIAAIAGEDPDQAAAPAAGPIGATAPSGSVSQRKTWIKNALIAASIGFMVLGARALAVDEEGIGTYLVVYGGLALASFFVYARITVHRATEDALPALPWGEMIVAVLTAAFSPNERHVSYTTLEGAAAAAAGAQHAVAVLAQPAGPIPPGSVTKRKLVVRNLLLFAGLVIMGFGFQAIQEDIYNLFTLLLVYGIPRGAFLLLASRIRFDRESEDVPATAPWSETISATLKAAVARRAPTGAAPVAGAVEVAPAAGPSPFAPIADAVRRNPKVLIIGVGAVVTATLVFYGASAIKDRFFGPAAGTGLESRIAAETPHDPPDTVLTMVESVSDGNPRSVQLKEIDNEGSHDRFTIALRDGYYYSIDGDETDLETFFAYAKANVSVECDVDYTSDGIFGLGMVGGGDVEAPAQNADGASPDDVSSTDPAPEASEGEAEPADTLASHGRALIDLTMQARSDGAGRVEEITFMTDQSAASGMVAFATIDAPNDWYQLDPSELGDCFVDKSPVGSEQFQSAIADGATHGMISFNKDGVTEIRASTDPEGPTDGY